MSYASLENSVINDDLPDLRRSLGIEYVFKLKLPAYFTELEESINTLPFSPPDPGNTPQIRSELLEKIELCGPSMGYEFKKLVYQLFDKYVEILQYGVEEINIEDKLNSGEFAQYQLTVSDITSALDRNMQVLLAYVGIEGEGDYNFMVSVTKVAAGNLALIGLLGGEVNRVNIAPPNCSTDVGDTSNVTDFWFGLGDSFAYALDVSKYPPEEANGALNQLSEIQNFFGTVQVTVSGTNLIPNTTPPI